MKCHDGIIIALLLFLCFEIPQQYKLKELYALQNQKVLLNNQMDLAIQEAAQRSFTFRDGKLAWNPKEAAEQFFGLINKNLRLPRQAFPVFLIREQDTVYVLQGEDWHTFSLEGGEIEKIDKIRETMEAALSCSIVSQKEGVVPCVSIPHHQAKAWYNTISPYGILVVFQADSRYASMGKNIYVVSGAAVCGVGR